MIASTEVTKKFFQKIPRQHPVKLKMTSIYGKTNHVVVIFLQDVKGGRVGNVELFQVSIPRAAMVVVKSNVQCVSVLLYTPAYCNETWCNWDLGSSNGCTDRSDIYRIPTVDESLKESCNNTMSQPDARFGREIEWYFCKSANKCVPRETRCDLHPHPACNDGEDETDCFEEYKQKHLISKSAHFKCNSPFHNNGNDYTSHRAQIIAKRETVESYRIAHEYELVTMPDMIVLDRFYDMVNELTTLQLKHSPAVVILATRCDSIEECWNGEDEKFCGISFTTSLILGLYCTQHLYCAKLNIVFDPKCIIF